MRVNPGRHHWARAQPRIAGLPLWLTRYPFEALHNLVLYVLAVFYMLTRLNRLRRIEWRAGGTNSGVVLRESPAFHSEVFLLAASAEQRAYELRRL